MVDITLAATEEAMELFRKIFWRKEVSPVYATRTVEGPRSDASWVAELLKDGVPYAQVEVGSISTLFARSK